MKFLVTGGAGFIGGNFAHYMVNTYPEDQIVVLDLLTYAGNLETLEPVSYTHLDVYKRQHFLPRNNKSSGCHGHGL